MHCDEHGTLDYCPYCIDEERALDINKDLLEALESVAGVMAQAIQSGDWRVDGSCEPDSALRLADKVIRKAKS